MSNIVVISGRISDYGPKLRPLPSGKWELSLTLCCDDTGRDGQVYTTYIPVLIYGSQCEPLAESLEPHDLVLVTGKLSWAKKTTKDGDKSGLAVTSFNVEVLTKAEVSPDAATDQELMPESDPPTEPQPKPRRRSYPRAALQGGFSPNWERDAVGRDVNFCQLFGWGNAAFAAAR
jgi:single-stranded DNA-binding protein